jgi:protease IV
MYTTFHRVLHTLAISVFVSSLVCGCDLEPPQPDSQQMSGPAAVLFNIDGSMPAFPNSAGMFSALEMSQYQLSRLLEKSASDIQVQEVVVHIGKPTFSFASASEIVGSLKKITATGKPLTCHIDAPGNLAYWIAARACPRILISPAGGVEALGLSAEAVYLRGLLASVGITADILNMGKYKDAAESLTRDDMSPEAREATTSLLFELHRLFIKGIAEGRKLKVEKVQHLIDTGPFGAEEAIKHKLADEISPLGTYLDTLNSKYAGGVVDDYGKGPAKSFSLPELLQMFSGDSATEEAVANPRIALVPVIGPISSGTQDNLFSRMEMVQDTTLVKSLSDIGRDPSVKAVVLRIDSPGGSALASDNIWHAVRSVATKKPVVVSMGDVAASGGYYIASAATEVFAAASTITGSIGVVGGKVVFAEAANKLGIKTERIETGKRASLESPFSPFDEDGRIAIGQLMQRTYDLFIDRIVEGRKLPREKVLAAAEGRVWIGTQALGLGLIDKTGNLHDAIARARKLAKVPAGTPVEILPKPKNLVEMLSEAFEEPQVATLRAVARQHNSVKRALWMTSLLLDESVLVFSPVSFDIH